MQRLRSHTKSKPFKPLTKQELQNFKLAHKPSILPISKEKLAKAGICDSNISKLDLSVNEIKRQTVETLPNNLINKLIDPSGCNDLAKQKNMPNIPLSMLSKFCVRNPEIVSKLNDQDTVNKLSRVFDALKNRKLNINDVGNKVLNGKVMKILIYV